MLAIFIYFRGLILKRLFLFFCFLIVFLFVDFLNKNLVLKLFAINQSKTNRYTERKRNGKI